MLKPLLEPEDSERGRLREGGHLSVGGDEEQLDAVREVEEFLGLAPLQQLTLVKVVQLLEGVVHVGTQGPEGQQN